MAFVLAHIDLFGPLGVGAGDLALGAFCPFYHLGVARHGEGGEYRQYGHNHKKLHQGEPLAVAGPESGKMFHLSLLFSPGLTATTPRPGTKAREEKPCFSGAGQEKPPPLCL